MPLAPELMAAHASIEGPDAKAAFYTHMAHPLTPEAFWHQVWVSTQEGFGETKPGQELKAWTAAERLMELEWAKHKRSGSQVARLSSLTWQRVVARLWPAVARLPGWRIGDRWAPGQDQSDP